MFKDVKIGDKVVVRAPDGGYWLRAVETVSADSVGIGGDTFWKKSGAEVGGVPGRLTWIEIPNERNLQLIEETRLDDARKVLSNTEWGKVEAGKVWRILDVLNDKEVRDVDTVS